MASFNPPYMHPQDDGLSWATDTSPDGWIAQVVEGGEVILESKTSYFMKDHAIRKAKRMLAMERYQRRQLLLPIGD